MQRNCRNGDALRAARLGHRPLDAHGADRRPLQRRPGARHLPLPQGRRPHGRDGVLAAGQALLPGYRPPVQAGAAPGCGASREGAPHDPADGIRPLFLGGARHRQVGARARGVACSGRGSAGNSIVCHALDITASEPIRHNLLFERFLNPNRREMPDIDVDFCSSRRDEVIEHIYQTFGNENVAVVANVNTMSPRSAVRIVAEALGYAPTEINALAKHVPRHGDAARIREYLAGAWPELRDSPLQDSARAVPAPDGTGRPEGRYARFLDLVERLDSFPMHLGTHLGGFVITDRPITYYAPLQWAAKGRGGDPVQQGRRRRPGPGQDGHPRPPHPLGRLGDVSTSSGSAPGAASAPTTCPPTTPPPTRSSATGDPSGCSSSSRPASATSPPACRSGTSTTSSPPSPSTGPVRWRPR